MAVERCGADRRGRCRPSAGRRFWRRLQSLRLLSHPCRSSNVGKKAPAFSLPDQQGKTHSLKDYAGKPLVLYFYPKDDTPGCTKEACNFQRRPAEFQERRRCSASASWSKSKAKFAEQVRTDLPAAGRRGSCRGRQIWRLAGEESCTAASSWESRASRYLIDATGKVAKRWDTRQARRASGRGPRRDRRAVAGAEPADTNTRRAPVRAPAD